VVGAGPAGATAARTLARAGVTVRLLDRSKFPRNKPCGGGITLRVPKRFPYLERELGRIATHRLSRLHLEGPGGESAIVEAKRPTVLMIRRVEFDALLVDLAVEAGAQLESDVEIVRAFDRGTGVVLEARDGRRFEAPIVVAADGVHRIVARRLGLNQGWPANAVALDMMEETPRESLRDLDPSTLWVAYGYRPTRTGLDAKDDEAAAEGYAYIFPKRDHVNIGVGYVLDYYRRSIAVPPYDLQRAFVDRLRASGVVEGESVRRHFTPFLIPIGGPLKRLGRGRVLLAGDAGGFVNGITAEGIYYAMVSGDLAAQSIAGSIKGPRPRPLSSLVRHYERSCAAEIGAELRDSVLIQRDLFADRSRISAVIRGANSRSPLTQSILDVAVGARGYRQLRRQMFAFAPRFSARLAWARARSVFASAPRSAAVSRRSTGV
jgi:geranylgeranyl reductase family protein